MPMPPIDSSTAAFVAGMVTSVHCVGMCGPLSCSWALSRRKGDGPETFLAATGTYHAARLFSYAMLGLVAGLVGVLPMQWIGDGWRVLPWLLVILFAFFALELDRWLPKPAALVAPMRRLQERAFRQSGWLRAGMLGLATPLLPCGPLYLMFLLAMANGSAAKGAEFALAFGLGTLPLLWLAQTQLNRLGTRLKPVTLKRVQRGLAFAAAAVMAWRLVTGADGTPICHDPLAGL
jgi:sulfite exporter TauE/SafE